MSGILIVAEHVRGELCEATREAITAAGKLSQAGAGPVSVVIVANKADRLIELASRHGVDEVVHVEVPEQEFNSELVGPAIDTMVRERQPRVVLMGFTTRGMTVGPAAASRLGLGFASDVTDCAFDDGTITARRQFYGGKVEADLQFPPGVAVFLLLRPAAWQPTEALGTPAITVAPPVDTSRVRLRHVEYLDPPTPEVDITNAAVIIAVGRGVGERENIERIQALAERMGASLASSRPLVDSGWVDKARQVGQSGVTVKPKLYLALGISGAVQHLAGMKTSERIVAVNHDPHAPIFGVAHYGAVSDLFDVVEELEKLWPAP